jgi:hypothetical protein
VTRSVILAGWAALAAAALVCEVVGAVGPRGFPTFGGAVDWLMRPRVGRIVLLFGWFWLGWHLFVR